MRHAWGAAASLGLLLAGCMVGPDYVTPSVPVTSTFKEAKASVRSQDGRPLGARDAERRAGARQVVGFFDDPRA